MKLTAEIFSEVVDAYQAGVKVRDIARNLDINVRWVFKCVEKTETQNLRTEKNVMQS